MLKFIGVGSAFNTEYCENSAYIRNGDCLFIIDCGCLVFNRLVNRKVLDGVKEIHIAITHTHPDHVGSLGTLLFYTSHMLGMKCKVLYPDKDFIINHLKSVGVREEVYELVDKDFLVEGIGDGMKITFTPNGHSETVPSYSLLLADGVTTAYYSGDTNTLPEGILAAFKNKEIDVLYHDTCGTDAEENPHMWLGNLEKLIDPAERHRVWCMHLDRSFNIEEAEKLGFNVAREVTL